MNEIKFFSNMNEFYIFGRGDYMGIWIDNFSFFPFNMFFFKIVSVLPGSTSYNHSSLNKPKVKASSCVKPSKPRSTTLMKSTASHLARQNFPAQHTDIKWVLVRLFHLIFLIVYRPNLLLFGIVVCFFAKFHQLFGWTLAKLRGHLWVFLMCIIVRMSS